MICAAFVKSFLSTLLHFSPSWIDILLTIIAKHLTRCEVLLRCQRCSSLWNGLHWSRCLCCRQLWRDKIKIVSLTQFWANFQSMEPNLSEPERSVSAGNKNSLAFPTTYSSFVKLGFQYYLWLRLSTETNSNQKTTLDLRCDQGRIQPVSLGMGEIFSNIW